MERILSETNMNRQAPFSAGSFTTFCKRASTAEGNVFDLTQMSIIFLTFSCVIRRKRHCQEPVDPRLTRRRGAGGCPGANHVTGDGVCMRATRRQERGDTHCWERRVRYHQVYRCRIHESTARRTRGSDSGQSAVRLSVHEHRRQVRILVIQMDIAQGSPRTGKTSVEYQTKLTLTFCSRPADAVSWNNPSRTPSTLRRNVAQFPRSWLRSPVRPCLST